MLSPHQRVALASYSFDYSNIKKPVQRTNCYDGNFSMYERYTHYEKRRLQMRERTSWGLLSRSSVSPQGDTYFSPEEFDIEELRWPWKNHPQKTQVRAREGGYTGTELIEIRGEDKLTTCYTPLTDPAANIRPTSWQLVSPMWKPQYEIAAKRDRVRVPWWARPATESLDSEASRELQTSESQKWQLLLEKRRQERALPTTSKRPWY